MKYITRINLMVMYSSNNKNVMVSHEKNTDYMWVIYSLIKKCDLKSDHKNYWWKKINLLVESKTCMTYYNPIFN